MDEFGVLVESIGFKGQRNSAPLADLKNKLHVINPPTKSSYNNNQTQKNYGLDDTFGDFKSNSKSSLDGYDLDLIFKGNNFGVNHNSMYADDDIFGGLSAPKRTSADDLFGHFVGWG